MPSQAPFEETKLIWRILIESKTRPRPRTQLGLRAPHNRNKKPIGPGPTRCHQQAFGRNLDGGKKPRPLGPECTCYLVRRHDRELRMATRKGSHALTVLFT